MVKLPKKLDKKDKKKRFQGQRQEYTRERKKQTPAITINTTNASKKRRRGVTLMRSCVLIIIRKATLLVIALSQKTNINLGNFFTSD